ncbi:hypothetical protein [Streptomyces sp. ISL-11]|nr:hypothetical protein [Streptomyces sp. ISL-11]MBT2382301.1 hypothetical protein [Streptomyces sp. ISL-11]
MQFIEEDGNRFAAFPMRGRNPEVADLIWVGDSYYQNLPREIGSKI